jgi:hypothetical protein
MTVLEASTTDLSYIHLTTFVYLAKLDTYLVTDTPAILKTAIVHIPANTKNSNIPKNK